MAAALAAAAGNVQAQAMVVTNDTLPVEKQVVRDILVPQRDSLRTVLAAAAQLQRDHATASTALMYSRGRTMLKGCRRSLTTIDTTNATIAGGEWSDDFQNRRRNELVAEMEVLHQALANCEQEWSRLATMEHAEEIRIAGLAAADTLVAVIHRYQNVVAAYYKVLDMYVSPRSTPRGQAP